MGWLRKQIIPPAGSSVRLDPIPPGTKQLLALNRYQYPNQYYFGTSEYLRQSGTSHENTKSQIISCFDYFCDE